MVVALANAPHESLFSTELVKTLVDHFWARYYRQVIIKCFIPFFVYMIVTLLYISKYTVVGIDQDHLDTTEVMNRVVLIILTTYFIYFEFRCIARDGLTYFTEFFNYLDIFSFSANIYCLVVAN